MAFQLTWLAEVLTRAGLKVSEVKDWQTRGNGDVSRIFGVICHHTAGAKNLNMPSLNLIVNGRGGPSPLKGPLAQLGLGRDGTYYVIAAGRANHAGRGEFRGIVNGNSNFIGIEAEHTGRAQDCPWPPQQLDAYQRGVAAILKHIKQGPEFCIAHREWAPKRKPDPEFGDTLQMDAFRRRVKEIMDGQHPPELIPPVENPDAAQAGGDPGRPTLRRGMTGKFTRDLQTKLKINVDGKFGKGTEAAVRAFQRKHGLFPDGIVGPKTWKLLDAA